MSFVSGIFRLGCGLGVGLLSGGLAVAQSAAHGRNYKPPPAVAHIVITVEKGFNSKPLSNAAVIFHATKDGIDSGNLEVKTDPDGKATMDLLEAGSHVTVQIIASGFATYATDFDVTEAGKEVLVKLQRPRAQVSKYEDNDGKSAAAAPGIQEPAKPAPSTTVPSPATSPATPKTGSPQ